MKQTLTWREVTGLPRRSRKRWQHVAEAPGLGAFLTQRSVGHDSHVVLRLNGALIGRHMTEREARSAAQRMWEGLR